MPDVHNVQLLWCTIFTIHAQYLCLVSTIHNVYLWYPQYTIFTFLSIVTDRRLADLLYLLTNTRNLTAQRTVSEELYRITWRLREFVCFWNGRTSSGTPPVTRLISSPREASQHDNITPDLSRWYSELPDNRLSGPTTARRWGPTTAGRALQ